MNYKLQIRFSQLSSKVGAGFFVRPSRVIANNLTPKIEGADGLKIPASRSFNVYKRVRVIDKTDGDVKGLLNVTGNLDLNRPGRYSWIYIAVDLSSNPSEVKRIITVKDMTHPVIDGADNLILAVNKRFRPKSHY